MRQPDTTQKKIIVLLTLALSILSSSLFAWNNSIIIPEVNLKSDKLSIKKEDAQVQTTHFDREQIEKNPVNDLAGFLRQEQSVVRLVNNSSDGSLTALSLRGFGANAAANSLILIDGFPLMNPSLLPPNFNATALSDIERIDILQGSEGTLWGDQAVGGVINIITRHPENFFANMDASLGSYNRKFVSVILGDKFKKRFTLKGFALANSTDNYRRHNQQSNWTAAAQAGIDYARGSLTLSLQSYENTSYFPTGLSEFQFINHPRQTGGYAFSSHFRTNVYQILSKHELNDDWLLETRLSYYETLGDGVGIIPFNRKDAILRFSPRLYGNIFNNKILIGYDGQKTDYSLSNASTHPSVETQQNNIYAQAITPLTSNVELTLGARAALQKNMVDGENATDSFNRVFVTEQGLSFHPNNNWVFFVRRDGNFSFPKANEVTWMPNSNQSLDVQTGTSYEIGSTWRNDVQKFQINFYRLQLNNEIAFDPTETPENPFGTFANMDTTLRNGVSIAEYYRITPRLTADGQINYVDARFVAGPFSGNLIPAVPAVNGNLGLLYEITSNWQARYIALYTGSRYPSEDVQNESKKLSGYWLSNIAIQYMLKSVKASFEIINLFDQRYAVYTTYNPVSKTNKYYPGAGRNYLLTLKVYL